MPLDIPLASQTDWPGFHAEALRHLALQTEPLALDWRAPAPADSGRCDVDTVEPPHRTRSTQTIVPASFTHLSELVVLHRDDARFELLYRTLFRLVQEPGLRHSPADADLLRMQRMAHAVRRDIHKMKLRVAFRPIELKGRTIDFAWYEPTHYICEAVAVWIARRQPGASWILLTPDRALHWTSDRLLSAPPLHPPLAHAAMAPDSAWVAALERQDWT
jgi:probable DNA metabolism protein